MDNIIDLNPVSRVDRTEDVVPGNYFRRTSDDPKHAELTSGLMVLVTYVKGRKVSFSFPKEGREDLSSWSSTMDEFLNEHEFEPNGRAIRDREMQEAMVDSITTAKELNDENQKLEGIVRAFRPKAMANEIEGETQKQITEGAPEIVEEPVLENREVGLVRVEPASTMLEQATDFISKIADRRNDVTRRQLELGAKKKRVTALVAEQKKWLEAMTGFGDAVKKLEEAIWTLNLYLGTGEQIIQLQMGLAASADVPLTIRQLVLCMDEECALESEDGGLDFRTIEQFDEWLLADPKNLRQVLPEAKGIVVLKPRRNPKDYNMGGDAQEREIINREMNDGNFKTYVLIRNGDSLFRVCPEWEVGGYFFPPKEEFRDAFLSKKKVNEEMAEKMGIDTSNWSDHERDWGKEVEYIVTPQDDDYEDVKEKIDKRMGYYSKALIMLQGIVDRTGIFPEYQQLGLNLMDVTQWSDHVRFVHDADPSYLLTTGRETFAQWRERTNKQLTVGDRIIALFSLIERGARRHEDSRKNPQNASDPEDYKLYTLSKIQDDGGLQIHYKRQDKKPAQWRKVPGSWRSEWVEEEEYKTKASFTLYKSDDGVLAFDVITLEEVDFFLTDRLSRGQYLTMFPLLKRVRDMKRAERLDEEPFIQLLIGEMMKEDTETPEYKLRREASDLIQWFKFKNKIHRSIKSDEAATFKMTMKEWGLRRKTDSRELTLDEDLVAKYKNDRTLLIAARTNYWTIIERTNEDFIFTTRIDLYRSRNEWKVERTKEFYIPGREWTLWTPIFQHEDWEDWPKGARSKDFLNPQELEAYVSENLEEIRGYALERALGYSYREKEFLQLRKIWDTGIVLNDKREIKFYFSFLHWNTKDHDFKLTHVGIDHTWKRVKGEIERVDRDYHLFSNEDSRLQGHTRGAWDPRKNTSWAYRLDDKALEEIKEKKLEMQEITKIARRKENFADRGTRDMIKKINEGRLEKAKAAYLARYGNPYLWETSKEFKGVEQMSYTAYSSMKKAIGKLLLGSIISEDDIYGKTVSEVVTLVNSKLKADDKISPVSKSEFLDPETWIFMSKLEEEDEDE